MKTEDYILIGGLAVVGYLAYKEITGKNIFEGFGNAVGTTTNAAITGIGTGLITGAVTNPLAESRQNFWRGLEFLNLPNPFTQKVFAWF